MRTTVTDPVLSPNPPGAPRGLTTNPTDLDAFALHAANLLGLDWRTLTPDQMEAIRQAMIVGLWLADPAARKLLARHILAQTHPDVQMASWPVREHLLTQIRLGLDVAAKCAAGMLPDRHQAVVTLADLDETASAGRSWGAFR